MPSWSLAFEGARRELGGLTGASKGRRAAWFGYFAVREALSTLKLIPFALRSASARSRLTKETKETEENSVALHSQIKYGDGGPRSLLDCYTPTQASREGTRKKFPVMIFVHGGVWSSGELWHYSSLGEDMAREGILVFVVTYNFYPDVLVDAQISDIQDAVAWVEDHCEDYGGDRSNISLAGHSSGAHLSMMATLARAGIGAPRGGRPKPPAVRSLILLAGVYDIERHYEYERYRGVHALSAMARAHGGKANFARLSPAKLLVSGGGERAGSTPEEIREEIEAYERERAEMRRADAPRSHPPATMADEDSKTAAAGGAGALPPIYLLSGLADDVVPHYWSRELEQILRERDGGPGVHCTVYDNATHLDFIAIGNRGPQAKADILRIRSGLLDILKS